MLNHIHKIIIITSLWHLFIPAHTKSIIYIYLWLYKFKQLIHLSHHDGVLSNYWPPLITTSNSHWIWSKKYLRYSFITIIMWESSDFTISLSFLRTNICNYCISFNTTILQNSALQYFRVVFKGRPGRLKTALDFAGRHKYFGHNRPT